MAQKLVADAKKLFELDLRLCALEDYEFEDEITAELLAIFIVPTYEGGTPNQNSKAFYTYIVDAAVDFRVGPSYLQRMQYAVFALGDSVYGDQFCSVGRVIDESLKKLGATRILARGMGDAQYTEKQFEVWLTRLWPSLLATAGLKSKLAEYRKSKKPVKEAATYVSDDETEDKEPLADVEDIGRGLKKKVGGAVQDANADADDQDDEDGSSATDDEGEIVPAVEAERKKLITPALETALTKQGYKLIGSHSGVKLCRWTKAMLRGRGGCYKHTFYNITSYQCMEMTPSLACANKCVFCWRHHKNPVAREWKWQMDQPEFLIEQAVEKHRTMIKQLKGVPGVDPQRYEDAFTIRHCALSLVGEPIIYPEINRFVGLLHAQRISSFMVTNAQFPEAIKHLTPVTQLYLSIDAATPESLKKVDRPVFPDFWERFLASIDALREKGQRTVFRLTLIREWNMEELAGYAELIRRGMPDFIEVKGVTYCGNNKASTLTIQNTPYHEEVGVFVRKLCDEANKVVAGTAAGGIDNNNNANANEPMYEVACEHKHSVCFLIANKRKFYRDGDWYTWIDYERFHELVQSGKPFTSLDYVAKTAPWAIVGSKEQGFDPAEERHFRKHKEGKLEQKYEEYANQGC